MKEISRLFFFEWKKIWKRKSTWITFGILLLVHCVMESFYFFGSTYVDGKFLETHMEGVKTDRENGRRLSGRSIDGVLLGEMQDAYKKYADEEDESYRFRKDYKDTVVPYRPLFHTLHYMTWDSGLDLYTASEQQLYHMRDTMVETKWENFGLTSAERAYWQKKEDRLQKPFIYQYADGYDYLISMSGVYRICMLVTFFIAVCIGAIFTEEHVLKTDQLIFCTRLGKKQLYFAKMLAGGACSFLVAAVLQAASLIFAFTVYGADGFGASIQLQGGYYSGLLSIGQVFLIMCGILAVSTVMVSLFTMVFSEAANSNIAAMAVVVAVLFAARLIPIPNQYRALSQAWNYLPINLLKFDTGFSDLRLVSIFGLQFTSWEFSVLLYLVFIIIILLAGKKIYCGYQVKGR